jgi:glycosyltransferase involved in cell wall biosynthesis
MSNAALSVLFITPGFPPNSLGGTEQHVRALTQALRDKISPTIIARDSATASPERDGNLLRLPRSPLSGSVDELVNLHDEVFEKALLQELAAHRPDIVHLHHWLHLSNSLVQVLTAQGLPVVVTLHDHYPICPRINMALPGGKTFCTAIAGHADCYACLPLPGAAFAGESAMQKVRRVAGDKLSGKSKLPTRIRIAAQRLYQARLVNMHRELQQAAFIISPSRALQQEIVAIWHDLADRITVKSHGIETAWAAKVQRQPSAQLRFAYVGTLAAHKGVEILLEAFRRLDHQQTMLTLYGNCPDAQYQKKITALAKEVGAKLYGRFSPEDLPTIYSEIDVAVVPSLCKESASLSTLEAFNAGVPVLAANLGALPEAVKDSTNGLLFSPGDATDLTMKMSQLMDTPALLHRLCAHLPKVKTMQEYTKEMLGVYEQVAK